MFFLTLELQFWVLLIIPGRTWAQILVNNSVSSTSSNTGLGVGDYIVSGLGGLGSTSTYSITKASAEIAPNATNLATTGFHRYANSSTASTSLTSNITNSFVYAESCNSASLSWSSAYFSGSYITKTVTVTYTNYSAVIDYPCPVTSEQWPHIVGSLTPTATGISTVVNSTAGFTFSVPAPDCSINPVECESLFQKYTRAQVAQVSINSAEAWTLSLAPSAASLVVGNTKNTTIAYNTAGPVTKPPLITFNSTTYTGNSATNYTICGQILAPGSAVYCNGPALNFNYMPPPACSRTQAPDCNPCTLIGGRVQLIYFPVTANVSRNQCSIFPADYYNPTWCPFGPTTAPLQTQNELTAGFFNPCSYAPMNISSTKDTGPFVVSNGNTFYKNRAYFSLDSAYASNSCGRIPGASRSNIILTLPSSSIFSLRGIGHTFTDAAWSFNFADLIDPIPQSAYFEFEGARFCDGNHGADSTWGSYDHVNGEAYGHGPCQTIYDRAFAPYLAVPPQLKSVDPAWANCQLDLAGYYDPPIALTQALTADTPSAPVPTSANPAPTPIPQTASSTTATQTAPSSVTPSPVLETLATVPDPAQSSQQVSTGGVESASSAVAAVVGSQSSSAPVDHSSPPASTLTSNALPEPASGISEVPASTTSTNLQPISITGPSTGGNVPSTDPSTSSQNQPNPTLPVTTVESIGAAIWTTVLGLAGGSSSTGQDSGNSAVQPSVIDPSPGSTVDSILRSSAATGDSIGAQLPQTTAAAQPVTVVVTVNSETFTAIQQLSTDNVVIVGSASMTAGSDPLTLSGVKFSPASSALIVDNTNTIALQQQAAPTSYGTLSSANGQTFAYSVPPSQTELVIIGSQTLTVDGAPTIVNGESISAAPSGVIYNGTSTVFNPANIGHLSLQEAVFTENGTLLTANQVPGASGVFVIHSQTFSISGAPVTIDGAIVSANSAGIYVSGFDGEKTPVSSVGPSPANYAPSSQAAVPFGSTTVEAGVASSNVIAFDTGYVTAGLPGVTIDGVLVSAGSAGLVVHGTQTIPLTAAAASPHSASGSTSASGSPQSTASSAAGWRLAAQWHIGALGIFAAVAAS